MTGVQGERRVGFKLRPRGRFLSVAGMFRFIFRLNLLLSFWMTASLWAQPVCLEAESLQTSLQTGALEARRAELLLTEPAMRVQAEQLRRLPSGVWQAERLRLQPCVCRAASTETWPTVCGGRGRWPVTLSAREGVLEPHPQSQRFQWLHLQQPRLELWPLFREAEPQPSEPQPLLSLPLPSLHLPLDPALTEELRAFRLWHESEGWSFQLPLARLGGGELLGSSGKMQLLGGWRAGQGPQLQLQLDTTRWQHRLSLEGMAGLLLSNVPSTTASAAQEAQRQGLLTARIEPHRSEQRALPAVQVKARVEELSGAEVLDRLWTDPLEPRRERLESVLLLEVPWKSGRGWLQLSHGTERQTGAGAATVGSLPWLGVEQSLPTLEWGDARWGILATGLQRAEGWQEVLLPGWTDGLNTLVATPTRWGGLLETRLQGQVGVGAGTFSPWLWVQGAGERSDQGEAGAVLKAVVGGELGLPLVKTYSALTEGGSTRYHRLEPVLGLTQRSEHWQGVAPTHGRLALGEGWQSGLWFSVKQRLRRSTPGAPERRSWLETGVLLPGGAEQLTQLGGEQETGLREALRLRVEAGLTSAADLTSAAELRLELGGQAQLAGWTGGWLALHWTQPMLELGARGWYATGEPLLLSPWLSLPAEAGWGSSLWLHLKLTRWVRGLSLGSRVDGLGGSAPVHRSSVSWEDGCGCVKLEVFWEGDRVGLGALP